jgi:hypothetical protein
MGSGLNTFPAPAARPTANLGMNKQKEKARASTRPKETGIFYQPGSSSSSSPSSSSWNILPNIFASFQVQWGYG